MDFKEYIKEVDRLYNVGNTTEHSFRGPLAAYLQTILKNFVVTNEPSRIDCGAPDFVITLKGVPVAYLEAKDINDGNLDGRIKHKDQFNRYKESLDRIIFTDYLDFHMYIGGEFVDSVRIAETKGEHIVGLSQNEAKFIEMVVHLATEGRQHITTSSVLARQMAAKAHLLADAVLKRIKIDGEDGECEMSVQLRAFRKALIHGLDAEEFADIYAQTIVYGMFTARLYDSTPDSFSRQEAANLIPKSNPFLRKVFQSIAGYDLDEGISWIVDDIANMFEVTDAERIMRNYGSNKRHSDPMVHFYEDFLAIYNPKLRKGRGVWYTPAPVVRFIVRSVDDVLQREFGLSQGLADSSLIKIKHSIEQSKDNRTKDGKKHEMRDVPRVQILDPATGTGTFLAEIIQHIRDKFDGLEGMWPSYVDNYLIPRLHGFEILMASYTIAHLKLALTLKATGYDNQTNKRLKVYLTNSLEEASPRADTLFSKWLADEADEASLVKTEAPVMICIGNPPYNNSSRNKNTWINNLIKIYKKDLGEKKLNLDDDYIKFIRLGQHYIEKNKEGILAYITNNSYVNGITHRQMRKTLLQTFDNVYILNLHGYYQEEFEDKTIRDENVFDITQGVCVNIFIKNNKKKDNELGKVHYYDLVGMRNEKYVFLDTHSIYTVPFEETNLKAPEYFFGKKGDTRNSAYEGGFSIDELFIEGSVGVFTGKDSFCVAQTRQVIQERINDIINLSKEDLEKKYDVESNSSWSVEKAKRDVGDHYDETCVREVLFRPFDIRYIYYRQKSGGLLARPCYDTMKHMLKNENIGLIVPRQTTQDWRHVFVANTIMDSNFLSSARLLGAGKLLPLFVERIEIGNDGNASIKSIPNLKQEIVAQISERIGSEVNPVELFDYIYAILHSPRFREENKAQLQIAFPRIPYPTNREQYERLIAFGGKLRNLHLENDASNWPMVVRFPIGGDNIIETLIYNNDCVWINKTQYFSGVSETAWNFYIGGYQPAQKWLKDRKGMKLEFEDLQHYRRIIYALEETARIMKEIDEVGVI